MKKLSIVIPVFNEKNTILKILDQIERVRFSDLEKEIIIIDDFSTDGTREILNGLRNKYRVLFQDLNQGKGAAIKRGLKEATGDFFIIQDADLEYDPNEYQRILEPMIDNRADVVYGSRFVGSEPHRVLYMHRYLANRFLTFLSNLLTGLNLTDMETCYKAFNRNVINDLKDKIRSKRFGIEPELTALVAKGNWRIFEVGISYYGRTVEEGKKIGWKDGVAAIWHIIKFNLFN